MDAPKYKRCDVCGRNDHKVAVRVPRTMGGRINATEVRGYCPSCFEDCCTRQSWQAEDHVPFAGCTVVYDRRGAAARKATPVPAHMTMTPVQVMVARTARETTTRNGVPVWKTCGHRAERDVNDGCYTCGRRTR